MTFKQWTAVIQVVSAGAVAVWLYRRAAEKWPSTIQEAAQDTLWAIGFVIVFNIVASIVIAILVSIARGEELKDERADERDRSVGDRSMRNAYVVASLGGLATLIYLAVGGNPALAPYLLFTGLMIAGVADAISRLVYYRLG